MFKGMKLSTKLYLGFGSMAIIALLLGLAGYYGADRSDQAIEEIGLVRLPSVESLLEIKVAANDIKSNQRTLLNLGLERSLRERQYENVAANRQAYEAAWQIYEQLPQTPEEAQLWSQFVPAWNKWREENSRFFELSRAIDALDLGDPTDLSRNLETFRADHYRVVSETFRMALQGAVFEGGESHTECDLGQWLASFQSSNSDIQGLIQQISEPHRRFHETIGKIKEMVSSGVAMHTIEAIIADELTPAMNLTFDGLGELRGIADQAISLQHEAEQVAMVDARAAQIEANNLLDRIIQINQRVANQTSRSAHEAAVLMEIFSLAAMVVGVIIAILLGFFITRSITRPINRIIQGLNEGAEQVSSASTQVSSASQSLAEGASEQAAAIEETSSSLEEMSSMTKQNAENAHQAKNKMAEVREIVSRVNTNMKDMTAAIKEITRSSEETGKIIKTIDEIAFQTNLLALNAAVEAARAGEAGAGFAVVADEVRNLAMRAAEAAKNTANLIEKTIKSVKTGNELTEATQEAYQANVEIAGKVGELVDEITAASDEQAQGIDQINKAVTEMDKVTQQNAANAEESASASEEMNAQADEMQAMVQELVTLVGGASARIDRATHGEGLRRAPMQKQVKTPVRTKALAASRGTPPATTRREVRPEQVIHLKEDDLKDF